MTTHKLDTIFENGVVSTAKSDDGKFIVAVTFNTLQQAKAARAQLTQACAPAPTVHELKTDPDVFEADITGAKTFEIRLNDRNYKVGDVLYLRETKYSGEKMRDAFAAPLSYTGRTLTVEVTHVLSGYGLTGGWVCLSFKKQAPASDQEQILPLHRDAEGNLSVGQTMVNAEKQIEGLIIERDYRDEIIDKLCDAVLGDDRPEWSSVYGFGDAVNDVTEVVAAMQVPCWPALDGDAVVNGRTFAKGSSTLAVVRAAQAQRRAKPVATNEKMLQALGEIRSAGNHNHPVAVWMQKVAAHAMDPYWPHPGAQP